MLTSEEFWAIMKREQSFGSPYPDLDSLWHEYELYMEDRLSYLHSLEPERSSLPPFDCTLETLEKVKYSIMETPGDKIAKELRLLEVECDISYVKGLRDKMSNIIVNTGYADIAYESYRRGIRNAGIKRHMEKEND